MEKKRIALIGFGGMGHWHVMHLEKSPVAELCGVYDINPERIEEAKNLGYKTYDSLDALLQDKNVQAAVIAVPNNKHKEIACALMNAGKHVICEKPVAMNSVELNEMIACAEKNKVVFTVHQNRRWDSDYLLVKELIIDPNFGDIVSIESRVHGSRGIPGDWRGKQEFGGGMVLDWGVHLLDQILMMDFGPVKSVFARADHITNKEVDDGFTAEVRFENGISATVEVGTSNFVTMPRWYVRGTQGSLRVEDFSCKSELAQLETWEDKDVRPIQLGVGASKTMAPRDEKTLKQYRFFDGNDGPVEQTVRDKAKVHNFYINFCQAMDGKAEQLVTHQQIRRSMAVMEAIFESFETGMPAAIKENNRVVAKHHGHGLGVDNQHING